MEGQVAVVLSPSGPGVSNSWCSTCVVVLFSGWHTQCESKGLRARPPCRAYALVASYTEAEAADCRGTNVLAKFKHLLPLKPASLYKKKDEKWKLRASSAKCKIDDDCPPSETSVVSY